METVLYADVLFLIDFSMDVVALWLTASFMHVKTSVKRVTVAALIGAAVSIVLTVTSPGRTAVTLFSIGTAFVMCKVAFAVSGKKVIKHTCALWMIGLLLGGVMSYLTAGNSAVPSPTPHTHTENSGIRLLPIGVLMCALLIFTVGKLSLKKTVNVEFALFDVIVKSVGLVDSGNLLCDPVSGYPVVLITKSVAEKLMDERTLENLLHGRTEGIDEKIRPRFRTVFAKGVTGETMLPCVRVDRIIIDSKPCRAIIGISDSDKFTRDIKCIVPSSLI